MCNISPLSLLNGYEHVYREKDNCETHFAIPKSQDKNYAAYWTIIDSMLYLYDVTYECATDSKDYKLNIDNIERFLFKKFSKNLLSESDKKDERFKNGVIHALWFTNTLYIKRLPKDGEDFRDKKYKSEKISRLVFEKGV
jgi:hypothetical protein